MNSYVSPDLFLAGPTRWPFDHLVPQAYSMIMADPAWDFESWSERGEKKSPRAQYETMSSDDIKALPVADLGREDCALWLWATWPTLPQAMATMAAWGFTYVTGGAWDKKRWGPGYVVRSVCEPFLIGKRGEPKICGASVPNIIRESRREHSRKPETAYELAEKMMPAARRADLFSRQSREGWDSWGRERQKFDEVAA